MSAQNLSDLEKNKKLKSFILKKGIWKNYAFLPPSIVLFGGLFGLIYLYKEELLISWYSIPFSIIFALGTVWFKSTRRYLLNKKINGAENFLICASVSLKEEEKDTILLFTTSANRQNLHYLEKQRNELLEKNEFFKSVSLETIKKEKMIEVKTDNLFISSCPIKKEFIKGKREVPYVVYVNNKELYFISKYDLLKFKK